VQCTTSDSDRDSALGTAGLVILDVFGGVQADCERRAGRCRGRRAHEFPTVWSRLRRPSGRGIAKIAKPTGKDPDFWYAFEEGKVKVIGDEPANTDYHPGGPSEKAVSRGEEREHAELSPNVGDGRDQAAAV
jgi:hypothetical protein